MIRETVEVKAAGKTIGEVDVEVFDSLQEASDHLGEENVLKMVNRQRRSEITNRLRVAHAADSPVKRIGALARAARKGEIGKVEAANQIAALLKEFQAS